MNDTYDCKLFLVPNDSLIKVINRFGHKIHLCDADVT